ncbi:MAG: glutamate 5-kinase [Alphaproteobacteria bacterium]|nr:glutamate 5-kinase [Alphaproteobacteria bacterium]
MQLKPHSRIVLKIGSNLLVEGGAPRSGWLSGLAADVAGLSADGHTLVVISSGAVALGRAALGIGTRGLSLPEKQAAAAVGQISLAQTWRDALAESGLKAAQVLLTSEDTEDRKRHLNARATLNTLLDAGVIPVINENDTVATAEIRVGDNDRLAARVAQMLGADVLILFSDIDGLYTSDPRHDTAAQHIPHVPHITPELEAMAGGAHNHNSTGGMHTKLAAAKIATAAGCAMIIANGTTAHPLKALLDNGLHTLFAPTTTPLSARKKWLAGMLHLSGEIIVDDGAAKALGMGKSLLPAGIVALHGDFERGDGVAIKDKTGVLLAKGLSAYDRADAEKLIGKQTRDIEAVLGYAGSLEVVHRDDYAWLR